MENGRHSHNATKKIFIIASHTESIESENASFQNNFVERLNSCGIETRVFPIVTTPKRQPSLENTEEFDKQKIIEEIKNYKANYVLQISEASHKSIVTSISEDIMKIQYSIELINISNKVSIWHGYANLEPKVWNNGGAELSEKVINEMKAKAILQSCPNS